MKMSSVQEKNTNKLKLNIQAAQARPFSDTSKCFLSPRSAGGGNGAAGAQKAMSASSHTPNLDNSKTNKFFR